MIVVLLTFISTSDRTRWRISFCLFSCRANGMIIVKRFLKKNRGNTQDITRFLSFFFLGRRGMVSRAEKEKRSYWTSVPEEEVSNSFDTPMNIFILIRSKLLDVLFSFGISICEYWHIYLLLLSRSPTGFVYRSRKCPPSVCMEENGNLHIHQIVSHWICFCSLVTR